jgi:hypothetical protein
MLIEEMVGDLKKHGFDFECTMLYDFLELSHITLAVAFLSVRLILVGCTTVDTGLHHLVDRNERSNFRIFQISLCFIQRRLTNGLSVQIPLYAYL